MLSAHRAHANELTTLEISDYARTAENRTWLRNQVFTRATLKLL
jgi:hypothetical protein